MKKYLDIDVLSAARKRISFILDNFESIYLSFSGGKDSTIMFHLIMEQVEKRKGRKVGVLFIDLEAQYKATIDHVDNMFRIYRDFIELYWVCLPIKLRNAVSNYQPVWTAWDRKSSDIWVREKPEKDLFRNVISNEKDFPFFFDNMEFEEFIILFGDYFKDIHGGKDTACLVGIRCDESLNRFRTIASKDKETFSGQAFTTKVIDGLYNCYPIYDWKTEDIWKYHSIYPEKSYNNIYELMHKAGVPLSQQRLCQPYGDDQKRGLWLFHLLEPASWYKVVARVNGANSGALYIQENGNITGYNKIYKPEGHTWKSFCFLLLRTMPKVTREHYIGRFRDFIAGWKRRGYSNIPDEAPLELENKHWAPSWRRMCKVLLRNDWWCKGLGYSQPKSEAYSRFIEMKKAKKKNETLAL